MIKTTCQQHIKHYTVYLHEENNREYFCSSDVCHSSDIRLQNFALNHWTVKIMMCTWRVWCLTFICGFLISAGGVGIVCWILVCNSVVHRSKRLLGWWCAHLLVSLSHITPSLSKADYVRTRVVCNFHTHHTAHQMSLRLLMYMCGNIGKWLVHQQELPQISWTMKHLAD